jgi:hypothetical protein
VKSECVESYFSLCNRIHPNQLTKPEVTTLKELLTSPKLIHWPIRSIHAHAFRENLITASLSTWYKYRKLLGVRVNNKQYSKKDRAHKPVETSKPNEKWHADITIYKTLDGVPVCSWWSAELNCS